MVLFLVLFLGIIPAGLFGRSLALIYWVSLISNTAQNALWPKRIVPTRAPTQAPSSPTIVSTSSARSSRLCETLGDIDCATATSDQKVVVGKLDSAVLSGIFASRDIAFVRPIDIMITWGPSAEHPPRTRCPRRARARAPRHRAAPSGACSLQCARSLKKTPTRVSWYWAGVTLLVQC